MEQAVLLTSVHVVDPQGPWHNQVVDVLLQGGQVADIGPSLKAPEALALSADGSMFSEEPVRVERSDDLEPIFRG